MKKIVLFFTLNFQFLIFNSFAQPAIEWQRYLGGGYRDEANSARQTTDGGYIVAGHSTSIDGDVTGNHSMADYWIVKLDNTGTLVWQKCFGGVYNEWLFSIQQTNDGGFIVAGYSDSNNTGDVTSPHGGWDYWVVKLDGTGTLQWQKSLGGTSNDYARAIRQTSDGGFIVVGATLSNDSDVTGNHGLMDYWVVKLHGSGTLQWQKCFGGTNYDNAFSVLQTNDGGYIVAGGAESNDGDVVGNQGSTDGWVIKLNASGILQWQKCYGGTSVDQFIAIEQSIDGGFILAGNTHSNDGNVTGNHGWVDYWIVQIDSVGTLQWQKCLGGTSYEFPASVQQTSDGGFIVAGVTNSSNGDITVNYGNQDYWIVKLDNMGTLQWQKNFGGPNHDIANSIRQTTDGGYIVAGYTNSNLETGHGDFDYWIIKLAPYMEVEEVNGKRNNIAVFPNPATNELRIESRGLGTEFRIKEIEIYTLFGEKIFPSPLAPLSFRREVGGEIIVNVSSLSSGIYFLKTKDEKGNGITKKFVKM